MEPTNSSSITEEEDKEDGFYFHLHLHFQSIRFFFILINIIIKSNSMDFFNWILENIKGVNVFVIMIIIKEKERVAELAFKCKRFNKKIRFNQRCL